MSRLFLFLLTVAVFLTQATIPVANNRPFYCSNRVVTKYLGCGACTVSDVLKVTGLSLFDFILLQNGHIGDNYSPIYPTTVIDQNVQICIAGYFM